MSNFQSVSVVKKLNDERMSKCFDKHGVFFAFSNEQLSKGMKKIGVEKREEVQSLGGGMICKADSVVNFIKEFKIVQEENKKDMIEKVGIDNLIRYELLNYECYYSHELEDAIEALEGYGITDINYINKIFQEEWHKNIDNW